MHFANSKRLLNPKITFGLLLAIWLYAFWSSIAVLCQNYMHSGFDYHGFLVIPVFLVMSLSFSKNLKRANINHNLYGLFLILFFVGCWLITSILELTMLANFCMISLLFAFTWMSFGKKVVTILILPLLSLYLLLPIGQSAAHTYQNILTQCLMKALMFSKHNVYWDGTIIIAKMNIYDMSQYLASSKFCVIFFILSNLYACFITENTRYRITISIASILMPACVLFLSIYSYITLNFYFGQNNFIADHIFAFGWVMTIIGLMHVIGLGILLAKKKPTISKTDNIDWRDMHLPTKRMAAPLLISICTMLTMPSFLNYIQDTERYKTLKLLTLPENMPGWKTGRIALQNQDASSKEFSKEKDRVALAISKYTLPQNGKSETIKSAYRNIQLEQQDMPVLETILRSNEKYQVVWQVNYVNGHYTTNKTLAKALGRYYNITSKDTEAGIISVKTETNTNLDIARNRLTEFLQDFTKQNKS